MHWTECIHYLCNEPDTMRLRNWTCSWEVRCSEVKTQVPGGAPPMHFLLHHFACRDEGLPRMETQPGDLTSICLQWHSDILGILVSTNVFGGTFSF